MSPRFTLRVVATLFVVAGLFLLRLATFDPARAAEVERIRGSLAHVEFRAMPKFGEWCVVTLTSGPTKYELQEPLEDDPALRSELAARLLPGVEVLLDCPRDDYGSGAPVIHAGPRPIQRLSANGALICDVQARRGPGQGLLHLALGVAAVLALLGGFRVFQLAGRSSKSGRFA